MPIQSNFSYDEINKKSMFETSYSLITLFGDLPNVGSS